MEYLIQIITAFLGSIGFAVLFNIKKNNIILSGIGGFLAWGIYLIFKYFLGNDAVCYFFAAIFANIYAEIIARVRKTPAVTILIVSMVPLIPGGALYYTMRYAFRGEWDMFFNHGLYTIQLSISLALGVIVVSTVLKMFFSIKKTVK